VEGTGAGIQPFKFTGKELIIMHGLNWQDYGARWLDNVRMEWTTMDPLCEKYYAISPYTYCSDDPAKNIDPDGRNPGDLFPSIVGAAKDFGEIYNGISIIEGHEYGSTIYKVVNKEKIYYSYSPPNKGSSNSVTPSILPNTKVVADIHSHGKYDKGYENNKFSPQDKDTDRKEKIDGYLTTPNGSLKKFNPQKDKVTVVSIKLPSDPNDPERKNNISPIPKFIQVIISLFHKPSQ